MVMLNDDVFLKIFKYLNFNERINVRLTSRRFKELCDFIKINKLIVYDRTKPIAGKLKYIDEEYTLDDTVEVGDLNKFFGSQTIVNQLRLIEKLAIFGRNPIAFEFDAKFDQLIYLELDNIILKSSEILQSPNIEYYINEFAYFREIDEIETKIAKNKSTRSIDSLPVFMYQPTRMTSNKIKCFSMKSILDRKFLVYCFKNGLFSSIEQMDVWISDLESLIFLNDHCPTLRTLSVKIGQNFIDFFPMTPIVIEVVCTRLRKDLSVNLFGMPLCAKTVKPTIAFLSEFAEFIPPEETNNLRLNRSKFEAILTKQTYTDVVQRYESQIDLTGFYKTIGLLHVGGTDTVNDWKLFSKLTELDTLCFSLFENPNRKFKQIFNNLTPRLRSIWFRLRDIGVQYDNEILDLLPTKCPNLLHLSIDNRNNKLNYDFVLKLERLQFLKLNLGYPIDQSVFLKLVKKMRYLDLFDVRFVKPANLVKDELSQFKKLVNRTLQTELARPDYEFTIQIHKRMQPESFVRYLVKHKKRVDFLDTEFETLKMYQWSMMNNLAGLHSSTAKFRFDIWFINIDDHFKNCFNRY